MFYCRFLLNFDIKTFLKSLETKTSMQDFLKKFAKIVMDLKDTELNEFLTEKTSESIVKQTKIKNLIKTLVQD